MADSTIDSDGDHLISDRQIDEEERGWRRSCTHRRCGLFSLVLLLISIAHALVIYFIYFRCSSFNCMGLKVVALNTWGMPALLGSEYKTLRMVGIGNEIAKADYDVFMLEELWMQADHDHIASRVPPGFSMTGFRELSLSTCDGRASPYFCSGLAVVSRYNFTQVEFNTFTDHGDGAKAFVDGEVLAKKGVGRVRIVPVANLTVDLFVTHTAADPDPSHGYNNSYYRVKQVHELMETYVSKSTADLAILGGDFNAEPETHEGSPYQMVRKHMKNCVEDIFYKLDEWLSSRFATYGNQKNTFTGGVYKPVTYDYIFHKTNNRNRTEAWTNWFDLPLFRMEISEFNDQLTTEASASVRSRRSLGDDTPKKEISFSDHEGIESTIYFWT